jgi:hypothetical protein
VLYQIYILKELLSHARFPTSAPLGSRATVADGRFSLSVPLADAFLAVSSFPFFSGREANMPRWHLGPFGAVVVSLFGWSLGMTLFALAFAFQMIPVEIVCLFPIIDSVQPSYSTNFRFCKFFPCRPLFPFLFRSRGKLATVAPFGAVFISLFALLLIRGETYVLLLLGSSIVSLCRPPPFAGLCVSLILHIVHAQLETYHTSSQFRHFFFPLQSLRLTDISLIGCSGLLS